MQNNSLNDQDQRLFNRSFEDENATNPNFLVVGAAKSGTTSLWYYLRQHPEIFMPKTKELKFLASGKLLDSTKNTYKFQHNCVCSPIHSIKDYYKEFENTDKYKAIGEASTQYLFTYRTTIPVIQKYIGDPKIIIILRNPVDRAFSAYRHTRKKDARPYHNNEKRTFEECLVLEDKRIEEEILPMMHFYKSAGYYYEQVMAYKNNFSNVKILLYEDLQNNPKLLLEELYEFLEVDRNFIADTSRELNVSTAGNNFLLKILFSKTLRKALAPGIFRLFGSERSMRLYNNLRKKLYSEKMNPETREYLTKAYREDILKLQDLICRDLSDWLRNEK